MQGMHETVSCKLASSGVLMKKVGRVVGKEATLLGCQVRSGCSPAVARAVGTVFTVLR
jgi:hypothetical protein